MKPILWTLAVWSLAGAGAWGADFTPAPQAFRQEIAVRFSDTNGLPAGPIQLIDLDAPTGTPRAFAGGQWFEFRAGRWGANTALAAKDAATFVFAGPAGRPMTVPIPWREVRQIVRAGLTNIVASASQAFAVLADGRAAPLSWPPGERLNELAVSPEGVVHAASSGGLYLLGRNGRERVRDPGRTRPRLGRAGRAGRGFRLTGTVMVRGQSRSRLPHARGVAVLRGQGRPAVERLHGHRRRAEKARSGSRPTWGHPV